MLLLVRLLLMVLNMLLVLHMHLLWHRLRHLLRHLLVLLLHQRPGNHNLRVALVWLILRVPLRYRHLHLHRRILLRIALSLWRRLLVAICLLLLLRLLLVRGILGVCVGLWRPVESRIHGEASAERALLPDVEVQK